MSNTDDISNVRSVFRLIETGPAKDKACGAGMDAAPFAPEVTA